MDVKTVHSLPAELGQQRGMGVENATSKSRERVGTDSLHVTGEQDQLRPRVDQHLTDDGIQRLRTRMSLTREVMRRNVGCARPLERS